MQDPPQDPVPSAGPDKTALWLSLGGASLTGLIFIAPALWAALTHTPERQPLHVTLALFDLFVGLIGLLVAVALKARRCSFLWALLATAVHLFWTITDRLVNHNWPGLRSDLVENGLGGMVITSIFAGPTSFVRWQMRLSRERAARAARAWQAPQETQEGIWPPPPTRPPLCPIPLPSRRCPTPLPPAPVASPAPPSQQVRQQTHDRREWSRMRSDLVLGSTDGPSAMVGHLQRGVRGERQGGKRQAHANSRRSDIVPKGTPDRTKAVEGRFFVALRPEIRPFECR